MELNKLYSSMEQFLHFYFNKLVMYNLYSFFEHKLYNCDFNLPGKSDGKNCNSRLKALYICNFINTS